MNFVFAVKYPKGTPFYIARGTTKLVDIDDLKKISTGLASAIAHITEQGQQPKVEIIFKSKKETKAYKRESSLIARYGRQDLGTGPLLNNTSGTEPKSKKIKSFNLLTEAPDQYKPNTIYTQPIGDVESVALNFSVSPEFRKEYRLFAANHDLSMVDILKQSFELLKQAKGVA